MLSDTEIYSEFQENYRYAHDFWGPFTETAQVTNLAAAGSTWTQQEIKDLSMQGREPLEFNIMRRPIQFFSGYLRDNLNSVVVSPVEGSDQKTADQFTKLMYYIWDKGGGYTTLLDAAEEGFKAGISLCGIYVDYSKDFINGDIGFFKRTYNSFYLDPTFEHIDLKDCGFAIMRDLLGKDAVKQMLPFVDPAVIDEIHTSYRDDKFMTYNPNFTTFSRTRNLMAYDQYYRKTTRQREFLVDESSGYFRDITDLEDEEKKKLETGMKRISDLYRDADSLGIEPNSLPPMLRIQKVNRDYVELHIMLNGQRVYCGEDKTGIVETYPFAPSICYLEPSIWNPAYRLQGVSQTLYSNQRQFNKRHMKIIDMIDSSISTGYKYLIGSVADVEDLQQAGQNKIIGIDPENAPQGLDSVQQLQGGETSPSLMEYQKILDNLSLTLANVPEATLGVDDKGNTQISGRLAEVRIAQGLRGNRKIFDNVETTQAVLGNLTLLAIQNLYPPEKIKRILGEEPTPQFYEKDFEQYDAVLKEGVRSKSQRDAYYSELVNLKRDGIVDVPEEEIVSVLPTTGQSDLVEAIERRSQQQAEQQKKIDEKEAMQLELDNSKKEENIALAQERRARVISDIGLARERASEANQNRAQAALDRAKTITEIAKMNDESLLKVLSFVQMLESQEMADRETVNADIQEEADEINTETPGSAESRRQQESFQELDQLVEQVQSPESPPSL